MRWIADQIEKNPLVSLRLLPGKSVGRYFKADARADGDEVHVGGFEVTDEKAGLKACRWFSFSLNRTNAPWAFVKEGEAFRVIASLEMFATILCVVLFVEPKPINATMLMTMSGVTDNEGNEALIVKNMTSKFPLYLMLIELAEQLSLRNMTVDLQWQRRDRNQAADDLTNGKFEEFSPQLRIGTELSKISWLVLPRILEEATALHEDVKSKKLENMSKGLERKTDSGKKRKRKAEGLRTSDPW